MKEVYAVIIFSIVVLLTGNINLNKERMKYLKTIDEFKKTNEQLFSDASKYAKLFGLDSAGSSSEDGKDKGSNSKSSGKGTCSHRG